MIRLNYKVDILPNTKGLLFKKNILEKILEPGLYNFFFINLGEYRFALLDSGNRSVTISDQEILSNDQVAFRMSYVVEYSIVDFEKASQLLDFSSSQGHEPLYWMDSLDRRVYREVQIEMNSKMAHIESELIFSDYKKLNATVDELVSISSNIRGIKVNSVRVKETSFPKGIQEIFSKKLEIKIRAQTELENARTTVAATRALNNAAAIVDENPGMRFLIYVDTLKSLAAKGKHTFVLGSEEMFGKVSK